jgi:hypothetical protein
VPAYHLRRPVKAILDRDEDMQMTGEQYQGLKNARLCRPQGFVLAYGSSSLLWIQHTDFPCLIVIPQPLCTPALQHHHHAACLCGLPLLKYSYNLMLPDV